MANPRFNHDQPIVRFLRRWLPATLPLIHHVGGYANRTTETGAFSFHSEGRAADIHLRAANPTEQRVGDSLFQLFIDHAQDFGVDHVIWNRQIWSSDRGGPRPWPAHRNPHTDHVHVAFSRAGSQRIPPYLVPLLDSIHIELFGSIRTQAPVPIQPVVNRRHTSNRQIH